MRLPKRGEKGFTLIELLIVVAILGVLAAVVIPNVGRFIGRGESEAKDTEFANIQSATVAMMVDNQISTLPNPILTGSQTNDMSVFPDETSDWNNAGKVTDISGTDFAAGDLPGFILYQHDMDATSNNTTLVNYVATATTAYWYSVDSQGTVTQHAGP